MSFYPRRAPQREKTIRLRCPVCTAPLDYEYDGTGGRWERSNDIDNCPKGHAFSMEMSSALGHLADQRAEDGVGDDDPRDYCGYDRADR